MLVIGVWVGFIKREVKYQVLLRQWDHGAGAMVGRFLRHLAGCQVALKGDMRTFLGTGGRE